MTRAAYNYEPNQDEDLRRELLRDQLSSGKGAVERCHAYEIAFRAWFGLGPQPARLLVTLYLAGAAPTSVRDLATMHRTTTEGVHRHICDMRKALDTEAIDRTKDAGYRLSDDGLAECRAVLWQVGESLRIAS